MDTNMAQALKMAGGVLIALTIIATLTYFFRELTPFQQQIEDIQELEQTADFNKQYEVYNKSLMLGVDIISVINKAYSNNRAYIEAYGYSDDIQNNYLIDIILETPVTLQQTLIVNDIYDEDAGEIIEKNPVRVNISTLDSTLKTRIAQRLKIASVDTNYPNVQIEGNLIIDDADYTDDNMYSYIIEDSVEDLKRNIRNNDNATINIWGTATLETYAYSLKNKKFRCTDVVNSEKTGRIISMTFREIQ